MTDPSPAVAPGTIVVLNGTPRSGKSSIVSALQASAAGGPWLNLGVDTMADVLPVEVRPGIGLRPGGERPDLEDSVVLLFRSLYATVAAWSHAGRNVVVDVGHHDDYARPLGILTNVAAVELGALPAYFVGVRCPAEVIMARRDASAGGGYVTSPPDGTIPEIVLRWERAVHDPGIYDLEVDTTRDSAESCVARIVRRVGEGPPQAFAALAARSA